jgi:hypothetical protein
MSNELEHQQDATTHAVAAEHAKKERVDMDVAVAFHPAGARGGHPTSPSFTLTIPVRQARVIMDHDSIKTATVATLVKFARDAWNQAVGSDCDEGTAQAIAKAWLEQMARPSLILPGDEGYPLGAARLQ